MSLITSKSDTWKDWPEANAMNFAKTGSAYSWVDAISRVYDPSGAAMMRIHKAARDNASRLRIVLLPEPKDRLLADSRLRKHRAVSSLVLQRKSAACHSPLRTRRKGILQRVQVLCEPPAVTAAATDG
jgi:hypothetical protein